MECSVTAYYDWTIRWARPGDASASSLFEMESIGLAEASGHLLRYLAQLMKMLFHHPALFFLHFRSWVSQFPYVECYRPLSLAFGGAPAHAGGCRLSGSDVDCGFCAFLIVLIETLRQRRVSVRASAFASVWAVLFASLFVRAWRSDYEETWAKPLLDTVARTWIWCECKSRGISSRCCRRKPRVSGFD